MQSPAPVLITAATTKERVSAYSWYVLATLCVVYLMNFLDRTLIYILFPPIKREMALSDLQLALLGTTSFVIFYTALGIPFGRLADRLNRKADYKRRKSQKYLKILKYFLYSQKFLYSNITLFHFNIFFNNILSK